MGNRPALRRDRLSRSARGLGAASWPCGQKAEHLPSWLTTLETAEERGLAPPHPPQQGTGYTGASEGGPGIEPAAGVKSQSSLGLQLGTLCRREISQLLPVVGRGLHDPTGPCRAPTLSPGLTLDR